MYWCPIDQIFSTTDSNKNETAVHSTDYATSVAIIPIVAKQTLVPAVVDITMGFIILITESTSSISF